MGGRKEIRGRYSIEGGSDFLCSWCCIPCALTQESRELALEEHSFQHVSQSVFSVFNDAHVPSFQ